MHAGFVSFENTGKNSTYSLLSVTEDCVIAASPLWTYIIYTGVADVPVAGENTTTTLDVFAENVIRLDTRK